jgi:ketosteroid isomerase-like protein
MTDHNDILATFEEHAAAYCAKDLPRLMALFDAESDISLIGTGADELCDTRAAVEGVYSRNIRDATAKQFEWHWRHVTQTGDAAVVAATLTIHIEIEGETLKVPVRWSVGLVKRDSEWKWTHRHASSAAGAQKDGAAYPVGD